MEVLKYAAHLFQRRPEVYHALPVQLALSIYKVRILVTVGRIDADRTNKALSSLTRPNGSTITPNSFLFFDLARLRTCSRASCSSM
jgi:hypothetical protein